MASTGSDLWAAADSSAEPRATLDLLDWRRQVHDIYRQVRGSGGGERAWQRWREQRDELFATHTQSPLSAEQRPSFTGLRYFRYDPAWALELEVEPVPGGPRRLGHNGEGSTSFTLFGQVEVAGEPLPLYWLDAYGGGVFVPFRDATNGAATYGGGRYALDTVKGADLGHQGGRLVLDLNFTYHPSCVYSPRWSCPLAPPESRLTGQVPVGERLP